METKNLAITPKNYYDVYYGRETVAIKSIKELPGKEMGIKLKFFSPSDQVSYFLCSTKYEGFRKLLNSTIIARFTNNDQKQNIEYKLKPVFKDRNISETYKINIMYSSTEFYKARKMTGHPHIISIRTKPILNIRTGAISDWIVKKPTPKEKEFALKKWGKLIERGKTNYEKSKILAKSLMHDLWPHSGFPSDAMKVSPFKQYERMVSGKDTGYCSNFSAIFACACNALGIPARSCGLSEIYFNRDNSIKCEKMNIQVQGGICHGTTEIFDEGLNQWIWLDLRYYSLGAWLGNVGPLTLAEFQMFINQAQRRKKLKLLIYDMEKKTEKMMPLVKSPRQEFECFYGWDRKLWYYKGR